MKVVKVGDLECIVVKTGESLFILTESDAEWNANSAWTKISSCGLLSRFHSLVQVDDCLQDYHITNAPLHPLILGKHHYRESEDFLRQYIAGLPEPRKSSSPAIHTIAKEIQGHLPERFLDITCVRIILDSCTRDMESTDIIKHVVHNNQSKIVTGVLRMSWNPSKTAVGAVPSFKYRFTTLAVWLCECIKYVREWNAALEGGGTGLSHCLCGISDGLYISKDPNDTYSSDSDNQSIDNLLLRVDQASSDATIAIRARLASQLSTVSTSRKVIYVKGWDIVAGYQCLRCSSCMVGRMEEYDQYMVEPYALSPSCTLALYIESNSEDDIRKHMCHGADRCRRGLDVGGSEWHHEGIIARAMVWDLQHTQEAAPGWYDRMYIASDIPTNKHNTIMNSFAAAMEADGMKPWRTTSGNINGLGRLVLTPSSGDWDDTHIGIPYMDSFEYGVVKGSEVWCYYTKGFATHQDKIPSKSMFELKCSGGLQEITTRDCKCNLCGDYFFDNDVSEYQFTGGYVTACENCRDSIVELDASYGREMYANSDDTFYCDSTGSHFISGDEVPDHIEIDGEWYHESSDEAMEYLAEQEAEEIVDSKDAEIKLLTVSCAIDANDLRRRGTQPIQLCEFDPVRRLYVSRDQWPQYIERMSRDATFQELIHCVVTNEPTTMEVM